MPNNRSIWLSIMTLAATMVGTATGILSWIGGMGPALALVAGCGSFATTILLSGDSDHLPAVRRLANNGIVTLVLFWEHATSAELRSETDFMPLDPFFDLLTRR